MENSMPAPTLRDLFERSIHIEKQAELVYRELAKRFALHPESVVLWKALAEDEVVHAQVLTQVLASASPENLASPAPAQVWTNVSAILWLMSQDLLGSIRCLKDAYELAHQLEYSEVNAIFEFLAVDAIPGNVEREFVRRHIRLHQKRLTDFSETYQGKNWQEVLMQ